MESQWKFSVFVHFLYLNILDVVHTVALLTSWLGDFTQELGLLYPVIIAN